jgi:hypothetical protein
MNGFSPKGRRAKLEMWKQVPRVLPVGFPLLLTLYGNLDIVCQATYQVTQMGSFIKEGFVILRPSPFDFLVNPIALNTMIVMILFYLIIPLLILISIRKMGQQPPDSQFKP